MSVAAAFVVAVAAMTVAAPAVAADTPLAVAHRGSHDACEWTENTYRAFRRCAAAADMIEVDLRLSSDGRPVFIHDATLDRTTRASGPVAARTLAELREVVTEDGVGRLPKTDTIAAHLADTSQWVAVDVKVWPHDKGWQILSSRLGAYRDRVVFFSSVNNRYVKAAKANGFHAAHYSWPDDPAPSVADVREYGEFVWRSTMSDAQAATYRAAGLRRIGGSNVQADWEQMAAQGAWAINTDRLPALLEWRG